jgi:hypothetical protein
MTLGVEVALHDIADEIAPGFRFDFLCERHCESCFCPNPVFDPGPTRRIYANRRPFPNVLHPRQLWYMAAS